MARGNASRPGFCLAVLLASFAIAVLAVLPAVPAAHASVLLQHITASDVCQTPQGSTLDCQITTVGGSALVVLFGCLSASPATSCPLLPPAQRISDSEKNNFSLVETDGIQCASGYCVEEAYVASVSFAGADSVTISGKATAVLGADLYDVTGVNATAAIGSVGASHMNGGPATRSFSPFPGGIVVAGVIANSASQFTADPKFTLIEGQPCFSCGQAGGWQASEYTVWTGGFTGPTSATFGYPATNSGWTEVSVSLAPNSDSTSVKCSPSPDPAASPASCTAKVTGDSPTGAVTWTTSGSGRFSTSSCMLTAATCSVSYTPSTAASPVAITANYGGDAANNKSSGGFSLSVVKGASTMKVGCSPAQVSLSSPTTCTATVGGASPTGTVTWSSSGVANFSPADTCSLVLATCAVSYMPSSALNPVNIGAAYSGDVNNNGSSSTFALTLTSATNSGTSTSSASSISSTSSVTSTTSVFTPSTSATTTTVTTSTTSNPATGGGGGVPDFPYQLGVAAVFTVLFAVSYMLVRNRRGGPGASGPRFSG